MNNKTGFRYDINALRAIAVLAVLLFHFKVPYFGGGFVGVDVFFVISGYLMTGIIIKGMERGTFTLKEFYSRRVNRIVPELLLMISFVAFVTFYFYLPVDYHEIVKNAIASLLFISNILYAQSSYFDASSDNNIFLHTWSLSVEWQFYLVLPLLLIFFNRFFKSDRNRFLILFVCGILGIFLLAVGLTIKFPTYSFYLLPSRTWEMLAGGAVFLVEGRMKVFRRQAVAIAGYFMIVVCIVFLNDRLPWPGLFTLAPVFATSMVILANSSQFSLFHNGIVQYLGKLSYSLYLWHWPVIVVSSYLGIKFGFLSTALLLAFSTVLATLSYKLVAIINIKRSAPVYCSAAVIVLIASSFMVTNVNEWRFKEEALKVSNYKRDHEEEAVKQFNKLGCFISSESAGKVEYDKVNCLSIDETKKNILLLGDSHAAHFSQSFRENFVAKHINLLQASVSGCLPLINTDGESRCEDIINYMYHVFIPENSTNIDGVLISANWCNTDVDEVIRSLTKTIKFFKARKIPIKIIGQNETYTIPYTSIAARELQYGLSISDRYLEKKALVTNEILKTIFKEQYIDIYKLKAVEHLSPSNVPYMMDQNHFTKYGADCVVQKILAAKEFATFLGG